MDTETLLPNAILGHYVILSKVAAGGMGIVYKGFETTLERHVAIKVLRPEFAKDPVFRKSFQEEARAVAALAHPNIVPIHYIGEENDVIYFSMGFIYGETFEEWIQRKSFFAEAEAFWFMYQAVSALDYAHRLNIIHLDIKPSNFLINKEGNIFLTDFGLAERLTRDKGEGPQMQKGFGTPIYASPEQILRHATDHRTDIYSLGVMLYYMMVGRPPYVGETAMDIVKDHVYAPFPAEAAKKAGVPKGWVELLERMLAKFPDERFADYTELYGALEVLRNLKGVHPVEYPARVIISTAVVNWAQQEKKPKAPELLQADLELMLAVCERCEGKILKTVIDGILFSFNNPDNALKWALEIQRLFALPAVPNKNNALVLVHRIGMDYGEFTIEGLQVYGDSISRAELVQSKAAPGTVCISGTVLELLKDTSAFTTVPMDDVQVNPGEVLKLFKIVPQAVAEPAKPAKKLESTPKPPATKASTSRILIYAGSGVILMLCILAALIYLATFSPVASEYSGLFDLLFPKK